MAHMLNILVVWFLSWSTGPDERPDIRPLIAEGQTMGTTYRVVYFDEPRRRNFTESIDSLLILINQSISTYDDSSDISRFNRSKNGMCPELPYLFETLETAKEVHEQSDGAFDPTIMPLVDAWGFGPGSSREPSASTIDSLKQHVGFRFVRRSGKWLRKRKPSVQLDMGGIGQGYGADKIFELLKAKGITNMLVELGGEGVAVGRNLEKDQPWTIGILDPNSTPENQFFKAYVQLNNQAFTTSGNYFNYRIIDGRKFGHTIDPVSGYPVQHSLLSASVFAADCTTADAWATAFMVMGLEKAIKKAATLTGIDVFFTFSSATGDIQTYTSPGLQKQVTVE